MGLIDDVDSKSGAQFQVEHVFSKLKQVLRISNLNNLQRSIFHGVANCQKAQLRLYAGYEHSLEEHIVLIYMPSLMNTC